MKERVPIFYTAGYQGRCPADLLARAEALGADVVDIRLSPCSQQPGWSKPELQDLFGACYQHVPALGNKNYKNKNDKDKNDKSGCDIRLANVDLGLKILLSPRRREAGRSAILLCGCRELVGCHRAVVAEALRERGCHVEELVWKAAPEAAEAIPEPAESPAGVIDAALCAAEHAPCAAEAVSGRTRGEAAQWAAFLPSGAVRRVYSDVLGAELLWAADDADVDLWLLTRPAVDRGLPVYTQRELVQLRSATADGLTRIHWAKTLVSEGGELIATAEIADHRIGEVQL